MPWPARKTPPRNSSSNIPPSTKFNPVDGQLVVTLKEGIHDYSDLATLLVTNGQKLTLFKEDELNLEGAFMALTKGITA